MDLSEKQARIMEVLEGVNPRFGMKASRIANELYGPPSGGRRRLQDGHKILRAVQDLSEKSLVRDVGNDTSQGPAHWALTDKGKDLLEKVRG